MRLRATLFDMDGLLFDTEVLWHRAEVEIFADLGVTIDQEHDRSTKGMYVNQVVEYWASVQPWSGPTTSDVVDQLLVRVGELVEAEGRILPGAIRAVNLASDRGPIALASSTPLALIRQCLDHFGLGERFASIHSAQFEPYGKPHPGVFLTAAASLNVPSQRCLVLEDSAAGVIAAKAANMMVVAVPTPADATLAPFAMADLTLRSLEDLSPDWLDERFE